jgi:hypothetical protein
MYAIQMSSPSAKSMFVGVPLVLAKTCTAAVPSDQGMGVTRTIPFRRISRKLASGYQPDNEVGTSVEAVSGVWSQDLESRVGDHCSRSEVVDKVSYGC